MMPKYHYAKVFNIHTILVTFWHYNHTMCAAATVEAVAGCGSLGAHCTLAQTPWTLLPDKDSSSLCDSHYWSHCCSLFLKMFEPTYFLY